MLEQAVILSGGRGMRLGEITRDMPKPMVDVGGRPFLEYLVGLLKVNGISRILFSVGYQAQVIKDHFRDGPRFGVQIEYCTENIPLGTGGGLKNCEKMVDPFFAVFNGDTLCSLDIQGFFSWYQEKDVPAGLALMRGIGQQRYGCVRLEGSLVKGFEEKGNQIGAGIFNAGVYIMNREVLSFLPSGPSSLEYDLFPLLAEKGMLAGKVFDEFFIDIGVPEALHLAQEELPSRFTYLVGTGYGDLT